MLLDKYWEHVDDLYARVRAKNRDNIIAAGKMIAEAVDRGACVHVHDAGHIIDRELIHRGGGLVLLKQFKYNLEVINPVRKRDRSDIDTSMAGLAEYAIKASGARPGDVFILGSVSGRTFKVIDLAVAAKKMGMKIIAITSCSYSNEVPSPHPCGKKLFELADIVLDNCAPAGEGMMHVDGIDQPMCAASGLAAAFIMWSMCAVIVEELLKMGKSASVLKSGNYQGGADLNRTVIEPRYEEIGY